MCLAAFGMWPEAPDLANTYEPWEGAPPHGPTARYVLGLRHAAAHIQQIEDALAQARTDRWRRTRRGRLMLWLRRRTMRGHAAPAEPNEPTEPAASAAPASTMPVAE